LKFNPFNSQQITLQMKSYSRMLSLLLTGFFAIHVHAQQIIYLETFNLDITDAANTPTTAAGWAGGYGGTAGNSDTSLRAANWYAEDGYGMRSISQGVNNHQLPTHTQPGTIVQTTDPAWVHFFTTEFSLGTGFSEVGRMEFDVLNLTSARNYHLTINAGGQWFISAETISTPNLDAVWHHHQGLDLAGVTWHAAPEAGFAGVGKDPLLPDFAASADAVPSGEVTGFGALYHMMGRGNVVIDNYTLYAVPEPAAFAWLAGLAAIALVLRRRSR
jgi:hypothetical protein